MHFQDPTKVLQVLFPAILAKLHTVDHHSTADYAGYVDIDKLVWRIRGDEHACIAFDRATKLNLSKLLVHLDLLHQHTDVVLNLTGLDDLFAFTDRKD